MANIATKQLDFSRINNLSILSSNTVRISKQNTQDISASPRLLNCVESVNIGGILKSVFYSEVDSNLKIGDKVFIINGNYDSNTLLLLNKYKKGVDGYHILDIDRCKITLDIDYTGILPGIDDSIDNFIKIYYVKDQREFDYANKQFISRDGYSNRFELYQNNFIYVGASYSGLTAGFGLNSGVTQSGFYGITQSNWQSVTSDLISGSVSGYLSTNFINNGRIKIVNGNFISGGKEWRESDIYRFDSNIKDWVIDVNYTQPFITKSNFRNGNFTGNWNKGIYGSYDTKLKWAGTGSNWNNGTTINTEWVSGDINSTFSPTNSYFAEIDGSGKPSQRSNINNNRGYGYNYFIDMDLSSSIINNGNYINCNVGSTAATFSAVDGYYQQWNSNLKNTVNAGEFTSCNFESSIVKNAVLNGSRLNNTHVESSKSINSHFSDSVFYKSNYESDDIIKIQAYDEWNLSLGTQSRDKMYKFYFNDKDFNKIKSLDKFYLKGLSFINSSYRFETEDNLLNFFDSGLIMDSYSDAVDIFFQYFSVYFKLSHSVICKLSTKEENHFTLTSYTDGTNYYTGTYSLNNINLPSIDIIFSFRPGFGIAPDINVGFDNLLSPTYSLVSLGNNIDITNAYIVNSYFDSGLFEQSNWNSGRYYNYNMDNSIYGSGSIPLFGLIAGTNGQLSMSHSGTGSQLSIQLPNNTLKGINDDYIKTGDIVYLNAIDYNNGSTVTRLPNTYKVVSDNTPGLTAGYNEFILDEYLIGTSSSIVSSLTGSGIFLTSPDGITSSLIGTNRYNYIHKLRINNSNIKNGLFRRAFITGSTTNSDTFNNSDYKFTDTETLKSLMFLDSIMSDNSNNIKSGVFVESYFRKGSDNWNNGILWKSIWQSGTFSNGVIRESNWIDGVFNSGMVYNTKSSFFTNDQYSYYKSGVATSPNNRYVWENGTFNGGDFFDSIWEKGTFNNGKIYKSSWTDGTFNNGIFGDDKFSLTDNNFYGGTFSNGIVINSNFYSGFKVAPGFNGINWTDGIFQSGVFKNTASASATWYNGTFNGGNFTNTSVWENGTFNGGKFTSYYGNTLIPSDWYYISNTQSYYSWQGGIFNGGEFGTADGLTNSTWFNGEFNGGTFKGKIWNNGLFKSGNMQGSATMSSVGGMVKGYTTIVNPDFSGNSTGWSLIDPYNPTQSSAMYSSGTIIFGATGVGWLQQSVFSDFTSQSIIVNVLSVSGSVYVSFGTPIVQVITSPGIYNIVGTPVDTLILTIWSLSSDATIEYVRSSRTNASVFVNSFSDTSYYGLWRSGIATNIKDKFIKNKELFTPIIRKVDEPIFSTKVNQSKATIENVLWLGGTFSHQNGEMDNVVWLDGTFDLGKFNHSVFNPYCSKNGYGPSADAFAELFYHDAEDLSVSEYGINLAENGYGSFTSSKTATNAYLKGKIDSLISIDGFSCDVKMDALYFGSGIRYVLIHSPIGSESSYNGASIKITVDSGTGDIVTQNYFTGGFSNDPKFNLSDTCIWKDGELNDSDFYISKWERGNFISGTGIGMIWKGGVANYMNAHNVFWENGLWRNGNWYGSSFNYSGGVNKDDFTNQILFRGMNWSGTSSCHVWNIFTEESVISPILINASASVIPGGGGGVPYTPTPPSA